MQDLGNTQYFKVETEPETGVKLVLSTVYEALTEKGYNPVNQIVGYIMSGDPTYITSHKNARSLIMKVERDELVEELLTEYIRTKHWKELQLSGGPTCVSWVWISAHVPWAWQSVTVCC